MKNSLFNNNLFNKNVPISFNKESNLQGIEMKVLTAQCILINFLFTT